MKFPLVFALGLSLLCGAVLLQQNFDAQEKENVVQSVNKDNARFVKLFMQLGDKNHEDVEKFKAPHLHEHSPNVTAPAASVSVSAPVQAPDLKVQEPAKIATEESKEQFQDFGFEEDERLRAQLSESAMFGVSDQVEGKFNEEQNKIKLQYEERQAKYRHMQEEYARKMASLNSPRPAARSMLGMAARKVKAQNPTFGDFKGALTKCRLTRKHDVHWINEQGEILSHVFISDVLTGTQYVARKIINSKEHVVVVVYNKGFEVYDHLGNLLESGAID